MLSFKQFLVEKDPFITLHRLNKRKGIDSEGEEETKRKGVVKTTKIKTRNIPLKDYDEDDTNVDDLDDKYASHVKQKLPTERKRFNIKELTPTQSSVRIDDLHRLKHKIYGNRQSKIRIATYKGKKYIMDGHHAIFGARLRGEKEIDADHYNLD